MIPYAIVGGCIAAVILTALWAWAISKPRTKPLRPRVFGGDYLPKMEKDYDPYLDVRAYLEEHGAHETAKRVRPIGKRKTLAAPYRGLSGKPNRASFGKRATAPRILLTARQMQHINIERRKAGRPMLKREGFKAAISHAWDQPVSAPRTMDDWTHYLILYFVITQSHVSNQASIIGGMPIGIEPSAPYFGQGCYAGDEVSHVTNALCGRDESGAYVSPSSLNLYPQPDPMLSSYADTPSVSPSVDTSPAPVSNDIVTSTPDVPSYSAPDTSSSFPVDTSSSFSVDTGSSFT
jgi:hypothetical protein